MITAIPVIEIPPSDTPEEQPVIESLRNIIERSCEVSFGQWCEDWSGDIVISNPSGAGLVKIRTVAPSLEAVIHTLWVYSEYRA